MPEVRVRLLAALLLSSCLARAGTSDTVDPVPGPPFGAQATFLSDLQKFLRFEDGARFAEQFQPFVVSGCFGPVSVNLTHVPISCIAYPGGLRTTETQAITYADNSTCYVIVHRDIAGNVTGPDTFIYTRVPNTHYAVNCTAPSTPQTPVSSVLVMKVTTTTGAITAVQDLRNFSPIGRSGRDPEPPTTGWSPVVLGATTEATIYTKTITLHGGPAILIGSLTSVSTPFASTTRVRLKFDGQLVAIWQEGGATTPTQQSDTANLVGIVPSAIGDHTVTITVANDGAGVSLAFNTGRFQFLEVR